MSDKAFLAQRFESDRAHLHAVAHRMLGSSSDADDAVQESWLRLSRSDTSEVDNLSGWLTTVVGRVCLDMLRSRKTRGEQPLDVRPQDPLAAQPEAADPEGQAVLSDAVGIAMLVVLEKLTPAERLAFVLHDMFAVPFAEIAPMLDRTPEAARQLASRGRRQVQGAEPASEASLPRQREVLDAFIAAARGGDFTALVAVLDPDIVLRADSGGPAGSLVVRGAEVVARRALTFRRQTQGSKRALIGGSIGIVTIVDGHPVSVMRMTIVDTLIVAMEVMTDPERVARLELTVLED